MGLKVMIKKLLYILFLLQLIINCYGQYNFFASHNADRFLYVDDNAPQYIGDFNYDIFFCDKPNAWEGTRMYVLGGTGRAVVYQYTITDWNISSAVYSQYKDLSAQDDYPTGIFIKNDGTKMYMIGTETDCVYQYSLSSNWVVGTASYDSKLWDISGEDTAPTSVFFMPDGSGYFILGQESDAVQSYEMLANWDVSTSNSDGGELYVGDKEPNPTSLFFSPDGLRVYIGGTYNEKIHVYKLSTAWTLPSPWNEVTATYCGEYATIANNPAGGLFVKYNRTKIYTAGFGNIVAYYFNEPKCIDLKEDLISVWELDETSGTTAYDSHGSNDLTNSNCSINQSGKIGTSYDIQSYDYLANDDFSSDIYAASFWVNLASGVTASSGSKHVFRTNSSIDGGASFGAMTGVIDDETFTILTYVDGVYGRTAIKDDFASGWHHIVINWNGSFYDIYVNGDKKTTYPGTPEETYGHAHLLDFSNWLILGNATKSNSHSLADKLDQSAIYNAPISEGVILELYNSGNGKAYSEW